MSENIFAPFMREALALAENGRWSACPNPTVGAVLVRDGQVVARGWHHAARAAPRRGGMPARRAASGHRPRPVHPGGHAGALQPLRQDPALQRSRAGRGHQARGHRPVRPHPQGGRRCRTPACRRCGSHRPGLRAGMPRPGGRLPGLAAGPPLCDPQDGRHHGRAHRHPYRPLPLGQQRRFARPGASPACRYRSCRGRRAGGRRHLPGRQPLPHGPHPR